MAWTYTDSPSTVPRDAVRWLVGDTNTADQQVTDAEVDFALDSSSSSGQAAAMVARALAAKYARQADKSVGDLSISASQRSKAYRDLADALESGAAVAAVPIPLAGGISIDDKRTAEVDTDRVRPAFSKAGFTVPGTGDDDWYEPPYHEQA